MARSNLVPSPRRAIWGIYLSVLALACAGSRLYYIYNDLPMLEGNPKRRIAPGPWPVVPAVLSEVTNVPDDLVLPTLKALMNLPGAADACDANTGRPRPDAAEYCVAIYRTPEDWRVSWPIRNLTGELSACTPPFGGVDDADFGQDLPILGFAHPHPCATAMSSWDLGVFPMLKAGDGFWVMVAYGTTPSGKMIRDSRGELIPAWHWLATGHRDNPRYYKWNQAGEVFRWDKDKRQWEFQAVCKPQSSGLLGAKVLAPVCTPELDH